MSLMSRGQSLPASDPESVGELSNYKAQLHMNQSYLILTMHWMILKHP